MKLNDVQLIRYTGENDKDVAEFANMNIGKPIPNAVYKTLTLVKKDRSDYVVVAKDDFVAKHGDKIKIIDEDIIHFLFQQP